MDKIRFKRFLSIFTSFCIMGSVPIAVHNHRMKDNGTQTVTDANKDELLGISNKDEYFLGAASQFSVFLHDDFAAHGSDCEGRLAAGGNANMGAPVSYSVGAKVEEGSKAAKVVVGGNTLQNFQPDDKRFVVGSSDHVSQEIIDHAKAGQCEIYVGQLIDFDAEFALMKARSKYLTDLEPNAVLDIAQYYNKGWTITGNDKNLNVLTLNEEQTEIFNSGYIQFEIHIPEGSYLVINVPGENVQLPLTTMRLYNDKGVFLRDKGENMPVLYNLKDAVKFKYTGSIQGSTLAPDADGEGDEGGHVSGATIAKSFDGGIQFGYSSFNPKMLNAANDATTTSSTTTSKPTTTTTTTTTTSTTTTATSTTTTTTSTTTTTTTTTTNTTSTTTTTTTTTTTSTTTTTTSSTTSTTSSATSTTTTSSTTATSKDQTNISKSTTSTTAKTTSTTKGTTNAPKTSDPSALGSITIFGIVAAALIVSRKKQ
ncbi:MAG: choice-of-anchor A family protein [Ruminococcus sp.]|uniref:choice-of-anchor A family protein n=1 Tax=Ruminococcus sp. TaxID=41978 RepID=UPI0025EE0724|nr:choice-of-anchor A family protein [Ruminococcus sp.]MCR5599116.1 choice-of-anchor A family protein [Ruminococcus sp.]